MRNFKLENLVLIEEKARTLEIEFTDMFDTHCHLLEGELMEVVLSKGVKVLLLLGSETELLEAVRLTGKFDNVFFGIGVHPHEAEKFDLSSTRDLIMKGLKLLGDRLIAIGEIGLDYYYQYTDRVHQVKLFKYQLELASSLGLPVSVHSRDAEEDVLELMEKLGYWRGVLHSYTGSERILKLALERGLYIGFNGMITFKNAEHVRELLRSTPVDRLLLETDSPYLAPVPFRGQVNIPLNLVFTLERVAELKGFKADKLLVKLNENVSELFPI